MSEVGMYLVTAGWQSRFIYHDFSSMVASLGGLDQSYAADMSAHVFYWRVVGSAQWSQNENFVNK